MPRRPILSSSRNPEPDQPDNDQYIRHDVVFPGFASIHQQLAGRQNLEREVRETDLRLDFLLEEKRKLERKRQELQELNEKQAEYRDRRDKIVEEVLQTLSELQKTGQFEIRRAETLERSLENGRRFSLNLETLQRLELRNPSDFPRLAEGIRRLKEAEAELEGEVRRLEDFEGKAPATHLFASLPPERRGFLAWARLGLSFFLPVIVVGLLAVIVVVAFAGK